MAKSIEINYNTGSGYEVLYPKTIASLVDGALTSAGGTVQTLTVTGQTTLEGSVRLKPRSSNYGSKLNFGDGDYCYIAELTDDKLEIKGNTINLKSSNVQVNGSPIGGNNIKIQTGKVAGTNRIPSTGQVIHALPVAFLPKFFYFGENGTFNGGIIDFNKSGTPSNAKFTSSMDIIIAGADLKQQVRVDVKHEYTSLRWGYSLVFLNVQFTSNQIKITLSSALNSAEPEDADGYLNGDYDYYYLAIG